MTSGEGSGDRGDGVKSSSEKIPRAHKRCVNKSCREVMSLATKVCSAPSTWGSAATRRRFGLVRTAPHVCRRPLPPAVRHCSPCLSAHPVPCHPLLSLQYCKKCNAVQFERRASKQVRRSVPKLPRWRVGRLLSAWPAACYAAVVTATAGRRHATCQAPAQRPVSCMPSLPSS